jgi:hypothetical protein
MSYEQHNRLWGTRLGIKRKVPSQREYVQRVTGLDVQDNFKAYWLLQLAAKPSARAWKRLTAAQQLAVQKLAEHQASGKGYEQFKFNQEWGID